MIHHSNRNITSRGPVVGPVLKYLFFALLVCVGLFFIDGCATAPAPSPSPTPAPPTSEREVDIQLDELTSLYIDLKKYPKDTVVISGTHDGGRLVFSDAVNKGLYFQAAKVHSTHAEDAIVFSGKVENFTIDAAQLAVTGGGITFWGSLNNVSLYGGTIDSTHTGIRATTDTPHRNITITEWTISNTSHEGVYLGVSKQTERIASGFNIVNNRFVNCGWDAIQVGNARAYYITGNTVHAAGTANVYGQDYGITVNPGSIGYLWDNTITGTAKPVQVLDARAFFHAPPGR